MKNLDPKTITLSGRHIIEASAGTGKTFNIAELYIRLLLKKNLSPKQILVMTFTKDAIQEIIGRIEQRIREELAKYSRDVNDQLLKNEIIAADSEILDYKTLKKALLEVDEAAIFTIHGFCKKVLSQQAFASGMDMDVSMEVNTDNILLETVEEYFRKYINTNIEKFNFLKSNKWHTPEKFIKDFKNIIKSEYEIVVENEIDDEKIKQLKAEQYNIFLENEKSVKVFISKNNKSEYEGQRLYEYSTILDWLNDNDDISFPSQVTILSDKSKLGKSKNLDIFVGLSIIKNGIIYSNVKQICQELRANFISSKQSRFVLDFDDLIVKLRDSLKTSPELVKILQTEYPVALIDEFQDTDSMQYEILDTIYPLDALSDRLLLMIGDPKQAIYGFRGGDIYTYLKAKGSTNVENQWSMNTNWRSTDEMVTAYNRLFYKSDFEYSSEYNPVQEDAFSKGIDYQVVNYTEYSKGNKNRIKFTDDRKALTYFRYQHDSKTPLNNIKTALATWTANEIVSLLNSGKVIEKDIAVLVKSFSEAKFIQTELKKKKISAVYLSQKDSIFDSNEAKEILMVLEGINELERDSLLKQALSTSLLGGTAVKLAEYVAEGSESFDVAKAKALELRNIWKYQNVMTMLMRILHENYTPRDDNKERSLTNILHLAELIKVAENKYKHPHQLIKWYKQQLNDNASGSEENILRLESDANLIKIVTIHGSKGLEYPIVFIPYPTSINTKAFDEKAINKYYDHEKKKTVYRIGKGVKDIVNQEQIEELMRLLYVAVTRASQRCYMGVANFKGVDKSSFARFFDRSEDEFNIQGDKNTLIDKFTDNDLDAYSSKLLINSKATESTGIKAKMTEHIKIDNSWQNLSFSSITKDRSEYVPEDDKASDETSDDNHSKVDNTNLEYRFTAAKGADLGNILHNVLEVTDFQSKVKMSDLDAQLNNYPNIVAIEDRQKVVDWLDKCLKAPIVIIDDKSKRFCLADLPKNKTLREPEFHIPLNNRELWQDQVAKLLAKYRKVTNVELPNNINLYGMLKGFIDLLFEYDGKFYVADYKSNYLGNKLSDYNQDAMCEKNRKSFYDLQYLVYTVALHRYLKLNKNDYDFEKDFGGVYYLYLRGMKDGYGVYNTKPSFEIINSLDKLFAGDKS